MGNNGANFKGAKNPNYKTGLKVAGNKMSGIHNSWCNMKQRCLNPKNPKYYRYGGRGITIEPKWLFIEGFFEWALSSGWKKGLTLDRIDNDGNYEPKNCRWVSASENSRKKSSTKITRAEAEKIRERVKSGECPYNIADEFGVVHGTIWFIINDYTHTVAGRHSKKKKNART